MTPKPLEESTVDTSAGRDVGVSPSEACRAPHVSPELLHRLAGHVFRKPRAYTTALLGGLDLVQSALNAHGLVRHAERVFEAASPLVEAAGARGITDLADVLADHTGRPSVKVSRALRSDELETALASAFDALEWHDLLPTLAAWSPYATRAVEGVELSGAGLVARRELVLALARRSREFLAAWEATPSSWNVSALPVDGRSLKAASRLTGMALPGASVAPEGEVPMTARYGNRVGRALGVVLLARLPQAVAKHAPIEPVRLALAVVGAVAEAVSLNQRSDAKVSNHALRVPPEGTPVPEHGWTPAAWWPVLDAWGSQSKHVQSMVPTSWRLRPEEFDAVVWFLSLAAAWVGTCADVPEGRLSEQQWADHLPLSLDDTWSGRMAQTWDLMQSTRPVAARAPWPSGWGESSAFSQVDLRERSTLPWGVPSSSAPVESVVEGEKPW